MSLVNDMLRDLQRRNPGRRGGTGEENLCQPAIEYGYPPAASARKGPYFMMGSGIAVFGLIVAGFWLSAPGEPPGAGPKPSDESPINEAPPAIAVPVNVAVESHSDYRQGDVQPQPPREDRSAEAQRIVGLLAQAWVAFSQNRLTTPAADNAFDHFNQVLALSPRHPQALRGLQAIVDRYLALAEGYELKGDIDTARQMLERADRVGGGNSEIERRLTAIERLPAPAAGHTQIAAEPVAVRPSFNERDQQQSAHALALIESGQQRLAERQLAAFIEANPLSTFALDTLFKLYLTLEELSRAETLLDRARHLPAYRIAHMRAQLDLHKGELEPALAAMEQLPRRELPAYGQAPEYYGYLAGLYHKAGRYRDAAATYRHLLRRDRTQAAYWLGLAVCLDALNDRAGALQAFRQAFQLSDAEAATRPYIQQRIEALSS